MDEKYTFSKLKSFSFYHAFILLSVAYVALAGGATIGYNVFGQYTPGIDLTPWFDLILTSNVQIN